MKESIYSKFLISVVRYVVASVSAIFVQHGLVDAGTADEFTTTAALQIVGGLISFGTMLWLSYKDRILEFVKTRVAIALPPNTSMEKVSAIANTVDDKKAVAVGDVEVPNLSVAVTK